MSQTSILEKIGLHRPELRAWAMYDWANSAFLTVVITAVFPIYFSSVINADVDPAIATGRFSVATTMALAVSALLGPLLGTLADSYAARKKMLGGFMALGVLCTAGLAFTGKGDWMMAAWLFGLANVGASGSFVFYDALLTHVARKTEVDRVSTAGYALGYLGGGLVLALSLVAVMMPARLGLNSTDEAMRFSFMLVALWWALFSIPLFRKVSEPPGAPRLPGKPWRVAINNLRQTFTHLKQYRQALILIVAFLIYNDGIVTIIRMASIFGTEMGLPRETLITAILLVQFVGIPFTFLFGAIASKIGAKNSIMITLGIYAIVSIVAYRMDSATEFYILAGLVAVAQGGSQALSRSLFSTLVPENKTTEFFGFFSVAGKFSGVMGSAIFTTLILRTGSSRNALLSLILFFVIGGLILTRVNVEEGQRASGGTSSKS